MIRILIIVAAAARAGAQPASDAAPATPVAPILAAAWQGWTNALCLTNDQLAAVILPAAGRVVWLSRGDSGNMLAVDLAELRTPTPTGFCGGAAVGLVLEPQETPAQWPVRRPARLEGGAWRGHAWLCADGSQACLLTRTAGVPAGLRLERRIRLAPGRRGLEISDRLQNISERTVTVGVYSAASAAQPEQAWLPMPPDNRSTVFSNMVDGENRFGMISLGPVAPERGHLTLCSSNVLFNTRLPGEYSLGVSAWPPWLAAQREDWLFVHRGMGRRDEPGGDRLTVELNTVGRRQRAEMLLWGAVTALKPGAVGRLETELEVFPAPAGSAPCELPGLWLGAAGK